MCGIVAFYDPEINDKQAAIGKMMATIQHRGPSSDGMYTNDKVALGFRRLSIIDLRGGSQPIYNEDRSRAIIFNGEIYNFKPLREELIKAGHTFSTKADTEVILHGYEEWGMDGILKRVRGCSPSSSGTTIPRPCTGPGTSSGSSRCTTRTWTATFWSAQN